MSDTSHVAFLGDRDHTFCLTPPMIVELEKLTGLGIGAIFARAVDLLFGHREVVETIRLALIGGGMSDKDAADLVATYVAPRPIHEVHPISRGVLRALWFGPVPAEPASDVEVLS